MTIFIFVGGAMAAGGGVGGGGVFVPMLLLIGSFQVRQAVPLSNVRAYNQHSK